MIGTVWAVVAATVAGNALSIAALELVVLARGRPGWRWGSHLAALLIGMIRAVWVSVTETPLRVAGSIGAAELSFRTVCGFRTDGD